jgi:uncharacterized protein
VERNKIIEILESLLKKNIIKHVLAIEKFSLKTAGLILQHNKNIEIDLKLISDGALLHDIGRSVTHSINHAVEGVKIAKKLGFNPSILSIIGNHIGAGITQEEAVVLGLPKKDYIPLTIEEKIVANSDNLFGGEKRRDIAYLYNLLIKQNNLDAAKRVIALNKELSLLANIDLNEIY